MRFSSRTIIHMAAIISMTSFLNACSKDEEVADADASEPVEAAAASDGDDAAVPAPAPAAAPAAAPAQAPEAAVPAAPAAAVDGTSASAPVALPSGSATRRVLYVKANGTPIRAAADAHAKVIGKLQKGDHILVNIEGAWARTDQGGFVAMKSLSEKGIGRSKGPVKWKGGHATSNGRHGPTKAPSKAAVSNAAPAPAAVAPSPAAAPAATQAKPDAAPAAADTESAPAGEGDGESAPE